MDRFWLFFYSNFKVSYIIFGDPFVWGKKCFCIRLTFSSLTFPSSELEAWLELSSSYSIALCSSNTSMDMGAWGAVLAFEVLDSDISDSPCSCRDNLNDLKALTISVFMESSIFYIELVSFLFSTSKQTWQITFFQTDDSLCLQEAHFFLGASPGTAPSFSSWHLPCKEQANTER